MMRAAIAFVAALLLASLAAAQGTITTVAGGGPNNLPATSVYLGDPRGVARDAAGNLYIVAGSRVFKVNPAGILTVFAGTGQGGFSGDGDPAPSASLFLPAGVAAAADGTIYIADSSNHRIRKVDLAGTITTVAGSGTVGFSGDGGPAPSASLSHTSGVAVAADGTLYFADLENHRIRKVDPAGTITTVAGSGDQGFSGDGGPAVSARLSFPGGVAIAADGTLYFADLGNYRIRKVIRAGTITTVAGSGIPGFSGDGGPAVSARLAFPVDVAPAADGSFYFADANNNRIRKVDPAGTISTVVGSGRTGFSGDGGPATRARLAGPSRVEVAFDGSLYIADSGNNRIRKVDLTGTITTMAGSGAQGRLERFFSGDGGAAPSASLNIPLSVAVAVDGAIYIADAGSDRVRKVDPAGRISTVAGSGREGFSGDNGPAIRADLDGPAGVAVAVDGSLYIADIESHRIRKVDRAGTITTVAGSGRTGYAGGGFSGDGGPATRARLASPEGVAVASDGTLYIADRQNYRVRKVDPAGTITTVAGNGISGFSGDGGPAISARLFGPSRVAVAADGTLYITDVYRVRKVDRAGVITTVAGTGTPGFSGDGGPAVSARLVAQGVAVAADGALYIADGVNARIRKVDPAGRITTVVGSGARGFSGDGGPPTSASLAGPIYVAVAVDGSLYIADSSNGRIRRVVFNDTQRR